MPKKKPSKVTTQIRTPKKLKPGSYDCKVTSVRRLKGGQIKVVLDVKNMTPSK